MAPDETMQALGISTAGAQMSMQGPVLVHLYRLSVSVLLVMLSNFAARLVPPTVMAASTSAGATPHADMREFPVHSQSS